MGNIEIYFLILGLVLTVAGFLVFKNLQKHAQVKEVTHKKNTTQEDHFSQSQSVEKALVKTQQNFWGRIQNVFQNQEARKNFEEIEEVLYTSDLGPKTVQRLMETVESALSRKDLTSADAVKSALKNEFQLIFSAANISEPGPDLFSHLHVQTPPTVWMIVGVNGAGKTTTIGKLSAHLAKQ